MALAQSSRGDQRPHGQLVINGFWTPRPGYNTMDQLAKSELTLRLYTVQRFGEEHERDVKPRNFDWLENIEYSLAQTSILDDFIGEREKYEVT
ncbi:hypothetical protein K0M31_007030 [Melipona bicolor]|uniref:Uncharacterized protein n=1 Tax=Melipona bicolor TaxID=60889 RepID=A0AA40KKP9_9HYME|nr:hypothetical protein K0M31_007030 [Melipona bicolor]